MPKGKKPRRKEPKRRQEVENQKDKCEELPPAPVETTENIAFVFKNDELQELSRIFQKTDLEDIPLLLGAVALGKFEIVKRLLRDGYTIDCCGKDGFTPLIWAAKTKNMEMIDLLVRRGANVSLEDEKSNNAILIALQSPIWDQDTFLDFWNSVKDNETFDPNHANKAGYTMLHYAVKNQWDMLLESLLEKGVNVNCQTARGITPLMMAGSRNSSSMVRALLRANADISIEDEKGCTVLCYAIAFMMQKKLETPPSSLDNLISVMNNAATILTIEDYLKRRLQLIVRPPELQASFADTVSSILTNVIGFFVRYIQSGPELLIELKAFSKMTEAVTTHMENPDYVHSIITIIFEMVRYCECCFNGGENTTSETDIMDAFFEGGTADACLNILKMHCSTTNNLIHQKMTPAALLPLFSACTTQNNGYSWLQSHYKEIEPFYHRYLEMKTVTFSFNADEYHTQLVRRKVKLFHGLMTKLENGEHIVPKQKALLKRGLGEQRSASEISKLKIQEETQLSKSPIGEKNTDDLAICLATCSKKMRRKVAKSLKMKSGGKMCAEEMKKLNALLSTTAPSQAPIQTASVPNIKNAPTTSNNENMEIDNQSYKKKIALPKEKISDFPKNANCKDKNVAKKNNGSIKNVQKETRICNSKANSSAKRMTEGNEQPKELKNHDPKETVDIFLPSGKQDCGILSDSDSIDETELETEKSDVNIIKEKQNKEQSSGLEETDNKPKYKSEDNLVYTKTPISFFNLSNHIPENASKDTLGCNAGSLVDYKADISRNKVNLESKENVPVEYIDFPTLESHYHSFLSKYLELWKVEREYDYPGHRCTYKGNRYLCRNKDETLKKLRVILPKLEEEYIQRLNTAWKSLSTCLKQVKNKERFTHFALHLKKSFLELQNYAENKLEKLRKNNAQNELLDTTDQFTVLNNIFAIGPIQNGSNVDNNPEGKNLGDLENANNSHLLQGVANLLQDDNEEVVYKANDTNESNTFYEESSIFANDIIVDNAAVSQKYDEEFARMSLEECILSHINAINKPSENSSHNNPKAWLPPTTQSNKDYYKNGLTESYEEWKNYVDDTRFSVFKTMRPITKNFNHAREKSSAFDTMSAAVRNPEYFYDKKSETQQMSLDDYMKQQRTSHSPAVVQKYPALKFSSNVRNKPNSLIKCEQRQQAIQRLQVSIPISSSKVLTETAGDRYPQAVKCIPDLIVPRYRWQYLLASFQSMHPSESKVVGNQEFILSDDLRRRFFTLSEGCNFGNVELGLSRVGNAVAVKRSSQYFTVCSGSYCQQLQMAVTSLIGIQHTHIAEYIQCILQDGEIFIVMPLCEYNLGEYIVHMKAQKMAPGTHKRLVKELLDGLRFLHLETGKQIVHGNLKPTNVLVDRGVLKLSDFGLTQIIFKYTKPPLSAQIWWSRETYEHYEKTWTMQCSQKSDIQVAGMIIHFILSEGCHPFGALARDILFHIAKGCPQLKTTGCEVNDLISWMIVYEPLERPGIQELFKHVYFWDINKKWEFVLACAGITPICMPLDIALLDFHRCLDTRATANHVKGDWVTIVKKQFPHMMPVESCYSDTPTGLLRFIRACVEDQRKISNLNQPPLHEFFLNAFPALPLSLYRLIEDTEWVNHPVLSCFTNFS